MVVCTLETTQFPGSHTGVRISQQIKSAVRRFDVDDSNIAGIVHDQAANVELAGNVTLYIDVPRIIAKVKEG